MRVRQEEGDKWNKRNCIRFGLYPMKSSESSVVEITSVLRGEKIDEQFSREHHQKRMASTHMSLTEVMLA